MTIITVDGKRVGTTQCDLCKGDVTLADLAIGNAHLSGRRNADSANGYGVMHNVCASRDQNGMYPYIDHKGNYGVPGTYEEYLYEKYPYEECPY